MNSEENIKAVKAALVKAHKYLEEAYLRASPSSSCRSYVYKALRLLEACITALLSESQQVEDKSSRESR